MTGALIGQLIVALGPTALELIPKLAAIWNKEQTPEEVIALCGPAKATYDDYIAQARLALPGTAQT